METWKISKTGTTYRFLQRWDRYQVPANTSFCQYYRMLAFNILKVFCYALTIPGMFVMVLIFTRQIRALPFGFEFWIYMSLSLFGIAGTCFAIAWIILGIMYGFYMLFSKIIIPIGSWIVVRIVWIAMNASSFVMFWVEHFLKKNETKSKPKQSFIRTWLQTKKDKLCPIVEFTEE